jgi:hypothetical protein
MTEEYGQLQWNDIGRGKLKGKLKNSEENCPCATLSSTNPIWTGPGMNLALCGERPVTKRLIHGRVTHFFKTVYW